MYKFKALLFKLKRAAVSSLKNQVKNEMRKLQFYCSLCRFPAEMAGGCEGVIRRIGILCQREARLLPPVQRTRECVAPPTIGLVVAVDVREETAALLPLKIG